MIRALSVINSIKLEYQLKIIMEDIACRFSSTDYLILNVVYLTPILSNLNLRSFG